MKRFLQNAEKYPQKRSEAVRDKELARNHIHRATEIIERGKARRVPTDWEELSQVSSYATGDTMAL